ncbi:MAG: ATP synthase F0 subunit B [Proteobacteria bacterium]|nr:ATP synthase F0 subunit B [Pseudomonadota bacterium]MBU1686270.1 ATP synthase F0 subunit B [Pseudomonadota bacterium]
MKFLNGKKLGGVFMAAVMVCGFAALAFGSGGEGSAAGGHGEGSFPQAKVMDLLWRALNFAGLVIILVWALKKPLSNALSGRRQGIIEKFEDLESRKADAERIYKEYEAKLAGIDAEVDAIVSAAVAQGQVEKDRIIADAQRAAGDIKRQAEMAIQHEFAEARLRLRSEIAEEAVLMAESIIKQNLQATDQSRLVEDYLEKVGAIQ